MVGDGRGEVTSSPALRAPASMRSRQSVWISPVTSLRFEYDAPMPEINRLWLQELVDTANSPGGLRVVPEPEVPATR